jgi:hypothetical protein
MRSEESSCQSLREVDPYERRRQTNLCRLPLSLGIEDGRRGVRIRQDGLRSGELEVGESVGEEGADGGEVVAEVVESSPTI